MNSSLSDSVVYILIIDDDSDDHFLLRKAISQVIPQAIVESLYDGSEARRFLENCTALPSLIFLDLNMPVVSGMSTIRIVRENESLCKIPIVVLTTSTHEGDKKEALNLGASDFYSKPYSQPELVKIVETVKEKWL